MKKIVIICLLIGLFRVSYSQDEKIISKMDRFVSRTGSIVKYDDYPLPEVTTYNNNKLDNKIRIIHSKEEKAYFYIISKQTNYDINSVGIEYQDLLEVIKALNILIEKSNESNLNNGQIPNYTVHKFITEDGFQIGYSQTKNDLNWFIKFDKYPRYDIGSPIELLAAFNEAKDYIEKMME